MTVAPFANPVFDPAGRRALKTISCVKLIQTEGMHDTAIITLRGEATDAPELQPGTPVMMPYGWSTVNMDTFYGYVDHVEAHYQRDIPVGSTYEDVVCMGVSYALKDPFVGTWSDIKASTVARVIGQKYFLSMIVDDSDYTWPQLGSPGSSAWTYLNQLANKLGYSLSCNKSLLRFVSVDTAMRNFWPGMPVFNSRNTQPSPAAQTLTEFQSLQGEALNLNGHTKTIRQINGIDLTSGNVVGAINDGTSIQKLGVMAPYPFFGQQISDTVVSSQGSARATLAGMAQCNRFVYQATATLSGLVTVRQGTPLLIRGIDSNNDGVWWVQEVTHKIKMPSYSMEVCLGRDSLGDSGTRPIQTTGVAYSANNPFVYAAHNAPPTILVNNRWRAASNFVAYVS